MFHHAYQSAWHYGTVCVLHVLSAVIYLYHERANWLLAHQAKGSMSPSDGQLTFFLIKTHFFNQAIKASDLIAIPLLWGPAFGAHIT